MINEFIYMDGYGIYVLAAFAFTLINFLALYLVTRQQFLREQKKFIIKFGTLNSEKAETARLQKINKAILSNTSIK
tara:strand:- start:1962 stop:2189 length:228 start_codon:yes stop_codon:yes gene_type:complete